MSLQLADLIEAHPVPALRYDRKNGKIIAANKSARKIFGYSARQWAGLAVDEAIHFNTPPNGKSFTGTVSTKNGERIPVDGSYWTVGAKNRKLHFIVLYPRLSEQGSVKAFGGETWVDKIVRVSHNEIYVLHDASLKFEYANTSALNNLGYTREEIRQISLTNLFHFPDEMALQALLNSLRGSEKEKLSLQLKFMRKDGTQYDADVLIQVLETDQYFLLIANDISNKLAAEKKLLNSVLEKETLVKEMHHRVKNNLQLISSIIYLKLATIEESDIRSFLEDTRQKIRSIALVHERLLQAEKLDKVEISDYLGKLVHDLQLSYVREDLSLIIHTNIEQAIIDFDRAIISGLIVNELVTNAMKHAFEGRSKGVVEISFRHDTKKQRYQLSVADDGITLPSDIRPGESLSFGMQLVDVFVKQLGGSFEIIREKGTTFQIHF